MDEIARHGQRFGGRVPPKEPSLGTVHDADAPQGAHDELTFGRHSERRGEVVRQRLRVGGMMEGRQCAVVEIVGKEPIVGGDPHRLVHLE